ncbi:MAG: hypothetical protein FJZ67_09175 [Bacteroidetes bacterium]|nr:hypothetical protein [Bacteroidota bacterium]
MGIFLCLSFGGSALLTQPDTKSGIFFFLGVYNIWQEGFVKDSSNWKVKPIYFVLATFLILLGLWVYRFRDKIFNNELNVEKKEIKFIDQLTTINQKFPFSIGNKDSVLSIKAIDDFTIEYRYKINVNSEDMDEKIKHNFIDETKNELMKNIALRDLREIHKLRDNKIIFKHIYLDSNLNEITTIVIDDI